MHTALNEYDHPYVTVDGVLLRVCCGVLEVFLIPRPKEVVNGEQLSLPGGFLDIDAQLDQTLQTKYLRKTGLSNFYTEQLKTFDAIDRDPRGRVLSVAYLCLTADQSENCGWYQVAKDLSSVSQTGETPIPMQQLAFDHGLLIREAVLRLRSKLTYTELPRYLLAETFLVRDAKAVFDAVLEEPMSNFWRWISSKCVETGEMHQLKQKGRPAAQYRWK